MNPKILIVDEDDGARRLLGGLLAERGYEVLQASSGFAGCVAAWREAPDLILMNLNLTDLDPKDAVRALRDEPSTVRIPVLALWDPAIDGLPSALQRGLDLLASPFTVADLLGRVRRLLPHVA